MTAHSQLTVPEDVLFREVDGMSILLNLDTEYYYSLDEVGTRMWSLLAETGSIDATLSAVIEEYVVPPDVVRRDLEALVSDLVRHGLLVKTVA